MLAGVAPARADYGQLELLSQGNGHSYGQFPWVSPDASRVIFSSRAPLVASDTPCNTPPFACTDVYLRSGGVTTLVSTGPSDANGAYDSNFAGASADGSKIFFETSQKLVPADTDACDGPDPFPDGCQDVYQWSGGTTTLISTGPLDANADYHAFYGGVTPDGAHVFFSTPAPLVTGDADSCGNVPPGCEDLYDRFGATTTLVSTGPRNANADSYPFYVGAADDASHVIFTTDAQLVTADHDSSFDLYDRSAGTTTLVSTGPAGGNDELSVDGWHVSPDGTRVVFATDESLVTGDADSRTDMYERASGVTSLVSTGPAGGNGDYTAGPMTWGQDETVVASDDGSRVFFGTRESLVSTDSDSCPDTSGGFEPGPGCWDFYERSGGQTTLVSTGPSGANTNNDVIPRAISPDGSRVYLQTAAPLSPADTDSCDNSPNFQDPGCDDVYLRTGGQTTFVSTSPLADGLDAFAYFSGATPDGARVFFQTDGTFAGNDNDSCPGSPSNGCWDIYQRAAGATSLASSMWSGQYGNAFAGVSADGSKVVFETHDRLLSSDSGEDNGFATPDIYSATLTTGHARPKAATPMYGSLVIAYQPCTAPDRVHRAPLSHGSCSVPAQTSSNLTVGTADSNGAVANSVGYVKLNSIPDPAGSGTSDMGLSMSMTDVRCRPPMVACGSWNSNDHPDYNGQLQARVSATVTDRRNGAGGTDPGTGTPISVDLTAGCSVTSSTFEGSVCSAGTTLNALFPGAVEAGARAIWELGEVKVYDGGPDGSVASSPNDLFAVQGIFVP